MNGKMTILNRFLIHSLICLALLSLLTACSGRTPAERIAVVSILPQAYLVKRICGDRFRVVVMIPPGSSPETYEPSLSQMKELGKASIYLQIGHIPFEKTHMAAVLSMNPSMRVVDCSRGVRLIREGRNEHHHGGIDPHTWLSPSEVRTIARNMAAALGEIDGEHAGEFDKNLAVFLRDMDALDGRLKKMMEPCRGRPFIVYHPAWSYFARDYGLVQVAIESEGKAPTPAGMRRVLDIAQREGLRHVIVQKQFPAEFAAAIAGDIGGSVLAADPLPADWMEGMLQIGQVLRKGCGK